jgi:hypothetical protein
MSLLFPPFFSHLLFFNFLYLPLHRFASIRLPLSPYQTLFSIFSVPSASKTCSVSPTSSFSHFTRRSLPFRFFR